MWMRSSTPPKQVLSTGKQRLVELLENFDDLRQSWLGAMSDLREGLLDEQAEEVHQAHVKASEKIIAKLNTIMEVADRILAEAENPQIEMLPVVNSHQPFNQVLIDREVKLHSESVLLEDVNGAVRQ